ncbi:phage tail protein [Neorhizobium sp. P12A]|uniref:phage tail protein n=1 Tax=Neorhizobium sp. P12A TaxID=2268027 RepID=UPI0011ED915F|nr:phage tail protein [Neorhizobium sp. P12A]KAA0686009.1 phage tail protein [Neorhizobium sp. P12A]
MPIFPQGALNTTALTVPDVYVQIIPPQFLINGVPSNIEGLVGTATWGPVNQPKIAGNPTEWASIFGPYQNRLFDMGTHAVIGFQQGATAIMGVRITDGTDSAALILVQTSCITFTSKYTGSFGNQIQVSVGPGSAASTFQVKIAAPGLAPEIFDNIAGSANALWVAMANAINNGNAARGPSRIIVATAGAGTTAPATASYTLAGGTDGTTTINATAMLGVDTNPRKGMYALRGQGVSVATLCDLTDSTSWATQITFGLSEGIYMVSAMASGSYDPQTAATAKATAGIDSYAMKLMLGDWVYWNDTLNGVPQRLVSPAAFVAGELAALSPEQSTLNKQLNSIVGTQKSYTGVPYTSADIQILAAAGIDVISNPVPGGNYFGCRLGHNTSSNAVIHGDNYTRLTNYIATTLNQAMGIYVGKLNSPTTQRQAKITLDSFLQNLTEQGLIGSSDGSLPYSVEIDAANNPQSRVALGYLQANVQVKYFSIVEFFLINLEAGQSVQVNSTQVSFAI